MSTTSPEYQTHEGFIASVLDISGAKGVDIGCGSGALVRWLRSQGADVVGVECGEDTSWQYQPEQTTSALICHHPKSKYFVAR